LDNLTDAQREAIEAVQEHGSIRAAAKAIGIGYSTMHDRLSMAAKKGYAPGHFEHGTAPGFNIGKVTVQRGPQGQVERTWERQSPEAANIEALLAQIDARAERITPLPEVKAPARFGNEKLFNQVSIFDGHIGANAWAPETGTGNWDLGIARDTILDGAMFLLDTMPAAQDCLVLIGGDFTEVDGYKPLTPESGHLLDADGRYPKIFEVAETVIEQIVCDALKKHRRVILRLQPGNHDKQTIFALRRVFFRVFRDNPRVTVDPSLRAYWAMLFGKSMIACHHGDKAKLEQLPLIFAADFAPMWGQATYRVCHSGHWHHEKSIVSRGREMTGMLMIQHPTVEQRNAWAADKGLIAARQLVGHTYHSGGAITCATHYNPEISTAD
jgi:hypothetical protein